MAAGILPYLLYQFTDADGLPLAGGKLYSYVAGTTTPQSLYTDYALTVPFSNPIVLNSEGRVDGAVYLLNGTGYKLNLTSSTGVQQNDWPIDNLISLGTTAAVTQTITTTGTTATLTLPTNPFGFPTMLICNNASLLTIQGIVAGVDGQLLLAYSKGAGQVNFEHQNSSASAANRLINFATSGSSSLAAGVGTATYQYDATTAGWRLSQHTQGAPIDVPFAAGNFTANGSMTWTVASGDQTTFNYYLNGRILIFNCILSTTTVAGTPNTTLKILLPNSFTTAAIVRAPFTFLNNSVAGTGMYSYGVGSTQVSCFTDANGATNWTAAADTTSIYVTGQFLIN